MRHDNKFSNTYPLSNRAPGIVWVKMQTRCRFIPYTGKPTMMQRILSTAMNDRRVERWLSDKYVSEDIQELGAEVGR